MILWLNGGPGSSSLIGWLEENGPLLINATGGLMKNPYAWTKVGHLLAIEQPLVKTVSIFNTNITDVGPCLSSSTTYYKCDDISILILKCDKNDIRPCLS